MKTGNTVLWGGVQFQILCEYDCDYVYLQVGTDGAHLVPVCELTIVN